MCALFELTHLVWPTLAGALQLHKLATCFLAFHIAILHRLANAGKVHDFHLVSLLFITVIDF